MDYILNKLNTEQKAAVIQTEGPVIILAGAGSGKTRVLVYRVLYLVLEQKISPTNLLMITFTNKAAGEMIERILKAFAERKISGQPTAGTFHSICAKILRWEGRQIGIPINFQIFDVQDQVETMKEALVSLDLSPKEVKPKAVLQTISQAKNQMIDHKMYLSFAHGYFQEIVAKVYPVYQDALQDHNALDFDDLLLKTIELFKKNPETLSKYQDKFKYVLVDEYQDTNEAQYQLTKLLGGKTRNLCIVGDFSQSIYSFRGADFRNLEKFKKDFPEAKVFPLSQNYRSTQKILDAAYAVISNNTLHPILSLWTENKGGQDIVIFSAESEHNEAEFIIQQIFEEMHKNNKLNFSDFAVLYRTNAQSRAIEETFLHNSIPYILVGGTRFYERREVKDVLAYLAFIANPKNKVAFKRLNKIGKKRFNLFLQYLEEFKQKNYIEEKNTIEIMDEVLSRTSYLALFDEKDPEDKGRIENIKELRSVAIEFPNLTQFLENVALVEQENSPTPLKASMPDRVSKEKVDAITLMTMHAAKGLEFRIVFIVGMEEGLFPHSQSMLDAGELEEERRLCYVGITRAKEKLYLTFAKRRLYFGQIVSNSVSRFIYELPEEVLKKNYIERYADEPSYL
ncbi:MAG: ATP-dependent DNA helicase UvrD/PcrA [Candidatus Levybacteria bacterium GW2011_GWA1_39_11]|nr:MAG: ATP-dependent DNA helicase UvrD/PcrA [Candidatus Levybacteria bacterium GW2011_GWA1_39_11]